MRTIFHTKKTLLCFFAVILSAFGLSVAIMCTHTAFAGNKQSLSDAVRSTVYRSITDASGYLQAENWTGACDMLMDKIDAKCKESSIELSSDQRLQIKDMMEELVISLNGHGMITFDPSGNLTELSKAYLSNAASYAVASVTGADEVAISNTVLSDLISTEALDTAVDQMKSSYAQSASQLTGESQQPADLSDIQAQLSALKKGMETEEQEIADISKLALLIDAVETMADTLKISPVTVSSKAEDLAGGFAGKNETAAKLDAVKSRLDAMQEALRLAETGKETSVEKLSQMSDDVTALAKELTDLKQSELDAAFNSLSREVSVREEAISSLKDELDAMTQSSQSTSSSFQNSISGLSASLSSMQTSLNEVKSEQQAALRSWKTEVNGSITTMKNEITALSEANKANAVSLASLNRSIDNVKVTVSDQEQTLSKDMSQLEKRLQAENRDTRQSFTEQLTSTKNQLFSRLEALDLSLSNAIDEETVARASGDAAFQEQIHSTANTSLEAKAEEVQGDSVFAKIGSLLKKINSLYTYVDSSVSGESSARETQVQQIKNSFEDQVNQIKLAMQNLQNELSAADSDNMAAITAAKRDLEQALDTLNQSLSGNISALDTKTQEQLAEIRETISTLQTNLEIANRNLARDLNSAKSTLSGQISSAQTTLSRQISALDHSLNQTVDAEAQAREAADNSLRGQIQSTANTDLEKKASEITGTTVFEKLGSLFQQISALKKTDEWAQNITLSHTASSGTKIYGILNSSDSTHNGWKVWKLDGTSLGLTFLAAGDNVPESEVTITYEGAPVIIMEYQIKDGFLMIYTPSVPESDIIISSIHVQNQFVTP